MVKISACVKYLQRESVGALTVVKGGFACFTGLIRSLRNSLIRLSGAADPDRPRRGEDLDAVTEGDCFPGSRLYEEYRVSVNQ